MNSCLANHFDFCMHMRNLSRTKINEEISIFFRENCKNKSSPAGNRTPVFHVTGGDTNHYTTEECDKRENVGSTKDTPLCMTHQRKKNFYLQPMETVWQKKIENPKKVHHFQ